MKTNTLLLLIVLFSGFRLPSVEVEFKGHLRSKTHCRVGGLVVFAKGHICNERTATTNENGDFNLHFDMSLHERKPISFYYVNAHNDTILLKRLFKFESDEPEMTFWIR
jgi:hypothetical protein